MHRLSILLISSCCLVGLLVPEGHSQRPVAKVSINVEKLLPESQEKLTNLQSELEQYINDYEWSDNARRYQIPVQIDIFFERAEPTSYEDRYDARFLISNGSDYQASDKRWRFRYQQDEQLLHTEQFHSLTGLIDFYLYIMLGQEFDKITKLGGEPYYQKAFQVSQLAKFSEFFQWGWKERVALIENILSDAHQPLRELEYFFMQARQWLRVDDRKTAGQYLRVILIRLRVMNREDEGTDRFYSLHHLELARMLATLGMKEELEELSTLDPVNQVTYQQFIDQIGP